ncbi:MAG TPA: MtrB/PioB family decaheme-associated outer membrane protein, partial [Sulfuricaulis sp.]|nr:MtrB/PioB family decaheme-associated outer membrane protein [Sulfuricaulis sp.]
GTADIAVGRMKQNEPFVPATLNATLPGFPFTPPKSSLDGEVKTLNANFKVTSALSDLLRLNAVYSYNDHDNQTPQAIYNWVNTDTFVATPRTNLPYSFTQNKLKLSADYGRATKMRTSVGFDHEATERTYQQVDETTENTLWAKFITRALENTDLTLKVAHAKRDKSGDQTVPGLTPPDNPLMTKYNVADRERDSVGLRADIAASETVNVGLGFDYSQDDYSNSVIGLTKSEDFSFGGDVSMVFTKQTSGHLFLNIEQIRSVQAGSQLFATPDWTGANKDTFHVLGIGVKHAMIKNKLDVGADYTVSNSVGKVSVTTGAPDPAFPDLESRLNSVKLYATYRLKDNMSLQGAYWFERYSTQNWMLENVAPGTIPNVLSLGEIPPSYRASVLSVSLRYNF